MDQVFVEEKKKLEEIETVIDAAAKKSRRKADALSKEITNFITIDYEDVGKKKELINLLAHEVEDSKRFAAFKPSPYFARLDLEREENDVYKPESFYIGKTGLSISGKTVIVDWRAPVGSIYYAQNQTSFDVKENKYLLLLRRALHIANGELISYKTEYDATDVSLEGELIDPFLLTVLKDKRRQNRLTDIIRTIQARLFIRLLFCTLYYHRPAGGDIYLNIDEAQDISIAEYTLLRKVLGNKCVFNLYGDINQAVVPEKSISDWEELKEVIGDKIFVLNENYRNTLQITEYCNDKFGAEIYPIGIKGEPVREMDLEQAMVWIAGIKKANGNYRAAVIMASKSIYMDNEAIHAAVNKNFSNAEVSWHTVNDAKVSVLTVEEAKGLEFEAVVALRAGMEINEEYIAYTRALDHLCIVKKIG